MFEAVNMALGLDLRPYMLWHAICVYLHRSLTFHRIANLVFKEKNANH